MADAPPIKPWGKADKQYLQKLINTGKVNITGTPGGVRSLRVTPGWIADATWAHLADDIDAPIEPIRVPGVTVGELAARWADAPAAPPTDAPQAADPVLAAALAAMASDDGADW
jgi:hypothetical protein